VTSLAALELIPDEDRFGVPLCERALVGALLIDGGLRKRVADLNPEQFQNKALGAVYEMLLDMESVDLVLACEEAERRGLTRAVGINGMATYLGALVDIVPDVEHVEEYAARVKRASIARQVDEMRADQRRRATR
jgi:replicative DNA helicase